MTRNKKIRFGLVFAGLLFFFNPYFAVIDLLPDFIGCLLIYIGLTRPALINHTVREARAAFLKLALIDIAKNVILLIGMGAGSTEQPTALLLISFSAVAVGLFFMIPAIIKLFDALFSLSTLDDCPALYQTKKKGLSRLDLLERQTIRFFFLKEGLCLLPEFAALTVSAYELDGKIPLYDFIGLMRTVSFITVLVLGILWLIRLSGVFAALWRDRAFFERIEEKHSTYLATHPGVAIIRRYGTAFLLLFAGALLLCDFYLDFKNVLPDLAAAILLIAGVLLLQITPQKKIATVASLSAFGAIATVSSHLSYRFALDFAPSAIAKDQAAADAYFQMWVFSLLELFAFLAVLALLLLALREVIARQAGYLPTGAPSEFDQRARKEFLEEFDMRLLICFVVGFLSALCSFLYDYIKQLPADGSLYMLEYVWVIDFAFALLFAFFFGNLLSLVQKGIGQRYQYD